MNYISALCGKIFGTENDRIIKKHQQTVAHINDLEKDISVLSDAGLKEKTFLFKDALSQGRSLDDILPEAFAVVREASKRTLGMRHFDVQLIGGMVLHYGMIAEMRTGEGKTLVSTLPAYLNALTGKGVHIVTVNDYLAKRDSEWMGQIHRFLGLSVGCIDNAASQADKKQAYLCDITYGTNNEYGFDYLRDNLAIRTEDLAQRQPHYAIIDEVDSILIDEARTPLIISGPTDDKSDLYHAANNIVLHFKEEHYELDEESKSVTLNDDGYDLAENLLQEKGIMTSGHLYDN
ncbi:MAG: DEAD/DEAH box helicase, partial [Pseudomonadota bacterium]